MRSTVLVLLFLLAACGSKPPPVDDAGDVGEQGSGTRSDDRTQASPDLAAEDRDITLGGLDGSEHALAAYRAPVTVVAMWASYCTPCIRELPLIEALHKKYSEHDDVTVLLVSIDEFDDESRAQLTRILEKKSMTVPALIDHHHALIERLAPRDAQGNPAYTVPMLVVIDEQFRLRRMLEIGRTLDEAVFLGEVSPVVDAALRGEEVPPEEPYEAPLGSGFTAKRSITLTVDDLSPQQVEAYIANLRTQLGDMYPDLHDHQLDVLMSEIEGKLADKLAGGGTFTVDIPPGHAAH